MVDFIKKDESGIPLYSPYNNARKIVLAAIARFKKYPSTAMAQRLEEEFGLMADYTEADAGEPPLHADYSHIISDPTNEDPY